PRASAGLIGTTAPTRPKLHQSSNKIVVVSLGDLAAVEFAGNGFYPFTHLGDVELAVNFGSMHFGAAFQQQLAFFGCAFEQIFEFLPPQEPLLSPADSLLDLHQVLAAAFSLARREFIIESKCSRALLVGLSERPQPVELRGFNEFAKFFEFRFRLAWKT